MKAKSNIAEKVFKVAEIDSSQSTENFTTNHVFRSMTTRKHYPGKHTFCVIVNGKRYPGKSFELIIDEQKKPHII